MTLGCDLGALVSDMYRSLLEQFDQFQAPNDIEVRHETIPHSSNWICYLL